MKASPDDLRIALQYHQMGRLPEADALYRAIIKRDPSNAEALHYRGALVHQTGNPELAATLMRRSIAARPNIALFHKNLAAVLTELGRYAEAEGCYDRALKLDPANVEAINGLGNLYFRLNRPADAEAAYRRVLALQPHHAEALNNLGCLLSNDHPQEAVAHFQAALRVKPDYADAYVNLGGALDRQERFEEAENCFCEALRLQPHLPHVHVSRGATACHDGRWENAAEHYSEALRLKPGYAEALNGLGNAFAGLDRWEEAERCYREALEAQPDMRGLHMNLGNLAKNRGENESAIAHLREEVRLQPDHAEGHLNLAILLLLTGNFAEGWAEYEWRMAKGSKCDRGFPQPGWRGEPIGERTLLLHGEQGFGDTLQFCRYLPLVAVGSRVILEVPRPLVRLLGSLAGERAIVAHGEALPPFDLHCPLMSLPHIAGTDLAAIPGKVPYLSADSAATASWARRLDGVPGLRVGLAWAGNPRGPHRRSVALDQLAPLTTIANVTFFSLQKDEAGSQVQDSIFAPIMLDWTEELADFADTAALIEALDLVISVDTAVIHLAGALGKPVWLLNRFDPCWRWQLDREDSPWYPTARIFRQPSPGDWESVIAHVADALSGLAREHRAR